jgi:hypothetical protein
MAKRTIRQNNARLKLPKVDDAEIRLAERNYAKTAALIYGACHLLQDHIAGTSWGPDITIDVAMEMLMYAKESRSFGDNAMDRSRT